MQTNLPQFWEAKKLKYFINSTETRRFSFYISEIIILYPITIKEKERVQWGKCFQPISQVYNSKDYLFSNDYINKI